MAVAPIDVFSFEEQRITAITPDIECSATLTVDNRSNVNDTVRYSQHQARTFLDPLLRGAVSVRRVRRLRPLQWPFQCHLLHCASLS